MTPAHRLALAELDQLTAALRDGTDQLAHHLAAVEAVAYPTKKSPRPLQRRGLQHPTIQPAKTERITMPESTVPEPTSAPQWPITAAQAASGGHAELLAAYAAGWRPPTGPLIVPDQTRGTITVPVAPCCGALPGDVHPRRCGFFAEAVFAAQVEAAFTAQSAAVAW